MQTVKCKCGVFCARIDDKALHNRLVCYCTDCRAYAHFLRRADEVLDSQGGTEIIHLAQSRLRFVQGENNLAAVRLSETGMVRWYASCCNTAVGNTMADPKMAFVGLIHACLDRSKMDKDFGSHVALLNTDTALGAPKPRQRGLPGVIARIMWLIITNRVSGRYRQSPLFNPSGLPIVTPQVLGAEELASLKSIG